MLEVRENIKAISFMTKLERLLKGKGTVCPMMFGLGDSEESESGKDVALRQGDWVKPWSPWGNCELVCRANRALMNSVSIMWPPVSRKPGARRCRVGYKFALPCWALEAHQGVGCTLAPAPC